MTNGRWGTRSAPMQRQDEYTEVTGAESDEPDLRAITQEQPASPATADTLISMAEHRLSVVRLELQRLGELQSEERRLVRLIEASRAEQ